MIYYVCTEFKILILTESSLNGVARWYLWITIQWNLPETGSKCNGNLPLLKNISGPENMKNYL